MLYETVALKQMEFYLFLFDIINHYCTGAISAV